MSTNTLKAFPITDLYENNDEKVRDEYSPYDDPSFCPEQRVLIKVLHDAVNDCRLVFEKSSDIALKEADVINAASASRFLLSDVGRAYTLLACQDNDAQGFLAAAKELATRTLELFGLTPKDVFRHSQESWEKSVNNGKWPKNFDHSKIVRQTQQGFFRLFLDTDKWTKLKRRKRERERLNITNSTAPLRMVA